MKKESFLSISLEIISILINLLLIPAIIISLHFVKIFIICSNKNVVTFNNDGTIYIPYLVKLLTMFENYFIVIFIGAMIFFVIKIKKHAKPLRKYYFFSYSLILSNALFDFFSSIIFSISLMGILSFLIIVSLSSQLLYNKNSFILHSLLYLFYIILMMTIILYFEILEKHSWIAAKLIVKWKQSGKIL